MEDQDTLAETENFVAWKSNDGGELAYHIELGGISLHLNSEEWNEFVVLIMSSTQE